MNALQKEYGGDHYRQMKVQPIELIARCNWNFIQGNIAKYVLRHKYKNGKEDLQKAIHYCEIGMELDIYKGGFVPVGKSKFMSDYCKYTQAAAQICRIYHYIDQKDYKNLISEITDILDTEYPSEK